jgi:hypothetical protein
MAKINAELQKIESENAIAMRKAELDHHAEMAGHAASIDVANAAPAGEGGGADPRVDELEQVVAQLRDVVMGIARAVLGPQDGTPLADIPHPIAGHPSNFPPPQPGPAPDQTQPPPGGFFNAPQGTPLPQ